MTKRVPWNKGLKYSDHQKRNLIIANQKIAKKKKGISRSPETKAKIKEGILKSYANGRVPWDKGLTKDNNLSLSKVSEKQKVTMKGNKNFANISSENRKIAHQKACETRKKNKKEYSEESRKNLSAGMKNWWKKMKETADGRDAIKKRNEKIRETLRNVSTYIYRSPSKPETKFMQICEKYNLPFRYTGNSRFWIGKNPAINPDFVECRGKKIAIEIFGDYWHSPLLNRNVKEYQTLQGRKKILRKYGWKLIVFWELDLKRKDSAEFILHHLEKNNAIRSK